MDGCPSRFAFKAEFNSPAKILEYRGNIIYHQLLTV